MCVLVRRPIILYNHSGSRLEERSGRGRKHASQARKKLGFRYMHRERPMAGGWSPETHCQDEMNPSRLTNHSNSPSPVPQSPTLFSSPPHRAWAKLTFLPDYIAHCLQQTFQHLTEFHLKPEKGKGSAGHRGPPPTQARIPIQDPRSCLAHNLQAFPVYESSLPNWTTRSWGGQGPVPCLCLPPAWGPRRPAHNADHHRESVSGPIITYPNATDVQVCYPSVFL